MGNFTLFEVHLHGENGGGFKFGPTFAKSNDKSESDDTKSSGKTRRFGRFGRSKNSDDDAAEETEIEVEDGDEMDDTTGGKSAGSKGALIAILFLVGAVMLVKKLRGGDGEAEAEVDLD